MFGIEPLTPAYGAVYKSDAAVILALLQGKDFKTVAGQYCSIRDLVCLGMRTVTVRYRPAGCIDRAGRPVIVRLPRH